MENLKNIFSKFNKRPVAFIGSGISKRYLDTPTWKDLLKTAIKEYDSNDSHYGKIAHECNNDLTKIAKVIEEEYTNYFYENVTINPLHNDYKMYLDYKSDIDDAVVSPYKIYTSKLFKESKTNGTFEKEKSSFINFLDKCANIITTNYDTLIEDYSKFRKVIGSRDFITDKCIGIGEVYKIHGCCTQPNSLVITSDDYEKFNNKNSLYHAKLLLSFIEQPIIFLGYSINDEYVEKIITEVSETLNDNEINELSTRLIFVEYDSKATNITSYIKQIKNINMTCVKAKDFTQIYNAAIENIKVGIPIELLRMFQESVKNMIYEQNNPEALPVKGLDDVSEKNLKAFFIGSKPVSDNTSMPKAVDLIRDILKNDCIIGNYDTFVEKLLDEREHARYMPSAYIPLYKILKNSTKYNDINIFNGRKIIKNYKDIISNSPSRKLSTEKELISKLEELINSANYNQAMVYLINNVNLITKENLRELLNKIYDADNSSLEKSDFRKLICYLDFLENK